MLGVLANAVCQANELPLNDYVTEDETKKAPKKDRKANENKEEKLVKKEEPKKEVKEEVVETEDLTEKTLSELKAMAKEKGLKGYSAMKKEELIDLLK